MNAHCPGTTTVAVNEGRGAGCISIHPALAVKRIREAAEKSLQADKADCLFPLPKSFKAEISFKEHSKAEAASWYPRCVRTGARTVRYESSDYLDILKFFFWVL